MRRGIGLVASLLILGACSGQSSVDAGKALHDGAAAMGRLKTISATLKFTKGAITFQGFTLVSARTAVQLPSDSDTTYTVKEQDVSISIEVVISGGHVYVHVPFSTLREVTGADAQALPDLAKLFDASTGLPAVIPSGTKPTYISTDQVDGASAYQIGTSYTSDQVRGLLAQLNSNGPVNARIWVDASDHLIHKAVLDGAFGDGGKEASVEVDMSGFNAPVNITSPSP
ncbi:MAG TPA: LppX_LprAFG lipoprotein [Candidatus Dormibacteraeota bacterium]|nr:LppX_LprAFG lipoprotein [Candidatus Dormibacteraeota bacterium]